jgi:hypothetical protein
VNIFAVNDNPVLAAQDLPDKLIVKMPTESLQLLTPWAFNAHGVYTQKPDGANYGIKGFAHHPCAKWLYESPANVSWLLDHAIAMSDEYTKRYGKQHGVNYGLQQIDEFFVLHYGDTRTKWADHTSFVQAMPEEFKIAGDGVTAYRNYINGYKGYAEWRYSEKPGWWDETKHEPVRKQYLLEKEAKRIKRQHDKHSRIPAAV